MNKLSFYPITLDGPDIAKKREEIKQYFLNTSFLFEKMFEVLKDDSVFYKKSEPTRHPMIFYFGHTAVFFVNKLLNMKIIADRINPAFESMFAVGVDEMSWDDVESSNYDWPSVDDVRHYRAKVRSMVVDVIDKIEFSLPISWDSSMWVILMGIEHERIHLETSSVLHRQMSLDDVKQVDAFKRFHYQSKVPDNELVEIPARKIKLGKDFSNKYYGWDNEYGFYEEEVASFHVAKYLVSNQEYLEFVNAGGYEDKTFWDEEGLAFLKKSGQKHPVFWVKNNDQYYYRTLSEIIELPLSFPVEVNALEAEAFCRYKSMKEGKNILLPSESEYASICEYVELDEVVHSDDANLNFKYASSTPVDAYEFNGIYDVVGNVWQWSRTMMHPFDGFKTHHAYDDFTVPTFDERHALILGSSWASSGNLITKGSRYAFRKHFFQHAGFRYVQTQQTASQKIDVYETDELVAQYCEFQYANGHFGVKNFALSCANLAFKYATNTKKALDLGCATGRATFELAKKFDLVEGVDFSTRFVQVGSKLQSLGSISYETKQEGDLGMKKTVSLLDLGYEQIKEKVSFWQGDACNLKSNFTGYDLVLATNLIDRLYQPKLFLESIGERMNEEAILIITSPYTWQESSTKKEYWLGGYKDKNGNEIYTLDTLKEILKQDFEFIDVKDIEFVIKETARKFQHTVSQASIWKKRA